MTINSSMEYTDLKNILHLSEIPITYLSNPKVACSTIKNSMLRGYAGNVHHEIEQACIHPNDQHHAIFSVTRNPFSRALSCYKNKIGWGKEATGNIWNTFRNRFNFPLESQPSFLAFLRAIADGDDDPRTLDIHYRPQVFNLHAAHITPSYTGRLENLQHLKDYLAQFSLPLQTRNPRPTRASETFRDEISAEEVSLIRSIYARDFEHYGYDTRLEVETSPPPQEQQAAISDHYLLRFRLANLGLTAMDLRTTARRRERQGDRPGALMLQRQLQTLKPGVRHLQRKIKRLTTEIEAQERKAGG